MRVATRRLRAALSLFREYLPARGETLRRELTRLGRALGTVRDLDVRLAQLAAWRESAPGDAPAFEAIEALLVKQHGAARVKLLRLLDTPRHERLVERLAEFVRRGPGNRPALGKRPAVETAAELLALRYRKVRKAGKRLSRSSPAADFHRMRILAKRLRYALEFHEPLYDGEVRSMIGHLTVLQDLLGEHQDLHVGAVHLETLAASRRKLPPRALFVMGTVASRLEHRAKSCGASSRRRSERSEEAVEEDDGGDSRRTPPSPKEPEAPSIMRAILAAAIVLLPAPASSHAAGLERLQRKFDLERGLPFSKSTRSRRTRAGSSGSLRGADCFVTTAWNCMPGRANR
jgi:CHAD domain-containing protein